MLMRVEIPVDAGNKAITDGSLPKTIMQFVEKFRPEATYFVAQHGKRAAFFFFDLKDPASIPAAAEPFFQGMNAAVEICPAMNLEEMKSGVARALGH
jgi:hypothetical protein